MLCGQVPVEKVVIRVPSRYTFPVSVHTIIPPPGIPSDQSDAIQVTVPLILQPVSVSLDASCTPDRFFRTSTFSAE
jgi:hypothetical protein